jgi:type IV pilus assembly protein PilO
MQELFDKLAAYPIANKVAALLGVLALLCGGYWYFFYSDLGDDELRTLGHKGELEKEKSEYETRKREYLAFANERNQLLEEQKSLLQALPKADDIEQFIESVQAQVELSGLQKVSSTRGGAIPMDLYTKIPITMTAVGGYHQINSFFKAIGELKRIVNIEDLQLTPAAELRDSTGKVPLKASFTATTFQYLEKKGAAGPTTTTMTAGGH